MLLDVLEKLLSEIQSWPGVSTTRTNVVLSTQKETTVLPLNYFLGPYPAEG